jgi:hypothetical protein
VNFNLGTRRIGEISFVIQQFCPERYLSWKEAGWAAGPHRDSNDEKNYLFLPGIRHAVLLVDSCYIY